MNATLHDLLDLHPEIEMITTDTDLPTSEKAAESHGADLTQIAKTLILKAEEFFIAAILRGSDRLNPKAIQKLMNREFRFATAQEVLDVTGYPVGAVAPIALGPKIMKVFVDRKVQMNEEVIAGGGERHKLLRIPSALIIQLNNAEVADIS